MMIDVYYHNLLHQQPIFYNAKPSMSSIYLRRAVHLPPVRIPALHLLFTVCFNQNKEAHPIINHSPTSQIFTSQISNLGSRRVSQHQENSNSNSNHSPTSQISNLKTSHLGTSKNERKKQKQKQKTKNAAWGGRRIKAKKKKRSGWCGFGGGGASTSVLSYRAL